MHPLLMAIIVLLMAPISASAEPGQSAEETMKTAATESVADISAEALEENVDAAAEADAATEAEAADVEEEATGLNIVMDGSSLEAFNESMEKVKETGSENDYKRLQDAFSYLLVFDTGARNNPKTLASRLDGLTGHQILERVKYGKRG